MNTMSQWKSMQPSISRTTWQKSHVNLGAKHLNFNLTSLYLNIFYRVLVRPMNYGHHAARCKACSGQQQRTFLKKKLASSFKLMKPIMLQASWTMVMALARGLKALIFGNQEKYWMADLSVKNTLILWNGGSTFLRPFKKKSRIVDAVWSCRNFFLKGPHRRAVGSCK